MAVGQYGGRIPDSEGAPARIMDDVRDCDEVLDLYARVSVGVRRTVTTMVYGIPDL